jgi:mannan endo-1,4-beta-mannosidase
VLRGVNEMVTYIPNKDALPAFTEIAKTHANSVRIYWHTSDSASDLDRVLSDAESQRLIPVIYVFNNETYGSSGVTPTSVSEAVTYWTSSAVAPVIKKHEHWLIISLREKGDSPRGSNDWVTNYANAVADMRRSSINVPLAIDAPNAGSDVATLLSSGPQLIADDYPAHNLLLNVNSGVLNDSADTLATQLKAANDSELDYPLLIGEISVTTHYPDYRCGEPYAYSTVLAAAEETQTGWLAWSWGARQNVYCHDLDMTTDGRYDHLTDWGLGAVRSDTNSLEKKSIAPRYVPGGSCD